jgi:hypothetical protein
LLGLAHQKNNEPEEEDEAEEESLEYESLDDE